VTTNVWLDEDLLFEKIGGPKTELGGVGRLSSSFWWRCDDDRLAVIVKPAATARSDLALAHALRHLGGRDLHMAFAAGAETPTLRRAAWLRPKIRVWTHVDGNSVTEKPLPARSDELLRFREAVRVSVAGLGERAEWIAPLLDWARTMPDVVDASREGYVDFQCDGRSVLHVVPGNNTLGIRAGTDWSDPQPPHAKPETLMATGPVSSEDTHRLVAAAARACFLRLGRMDAANGEHRLQARLRARHLGLTDWRRELPAVRPAAAGKGSDALGGRRAYIDFLGVKGSALHVVETKIGPDEFLVLQGLDYWTWVMGQRDRLAVLFALPTTTPKIVMDFVIARTSNGQVLSPYSGAQALALDGEIDWRFHEVLSWDDGEPVLRSLPARTLP
jgi:hypothetical protein